MYRKPVILSLLLLLFLVSIPIYAQAGNVSETLYNRRIVWRADQYAYRYRVDVERSDNGTFRSQLSEYSTASFLVVSLPAGEYRFRITAYDILDRPQPPTQWHPFAVRHPVVPETRDASETAPDNEIVEIQVIESREEGEGNREAEPQVQGNDKTIESGEEGEAEPQVQSMGSSSRFNTIGVSVGTSFIDPLVIAAIHGSYAPFQNIFIELGFEAGFLSIYEEVESFYCLYPYANLGFFMPFSDKGGFFAGIGGGLMMVNYTFTDIKKDMGLLAMNIFTGVNLWDMLNITYTFKTTFGEMSHKVGVGYVFRIGNRE